MNFNLPWYWWILIIILLPVFMVYTAVEWAVTVVAAWMRSPIL